MVRTFLLGLFLMLPIQALAAAEAHALDWKGLGWRLLVFVMFVGILYYILRKPIKKMFHNRTADIEKALKQAEVAQAEAKAQVEEYAKKMIELEKELATMKENALKAAELERKTIIEDAEHSVTKMKNFAINMIEAETTQAKNELKKEIVNMVMQEAQKQIEDDVKGKKSEAVLESYIKRIGESK